MLSARWTDLTMKPSEKNCTPRGVMRQRAIATASAARVHLRQVASLLSRPVEKWGQYSVGAAFAPFKA
jgi:hypothetical protein